MEWLLTGAALNAGGRVRWVYTETETRITPDDALRLTGNPEVGTNTAPRFDSQLPGAQIVTDYRLNSPSSRRAAVKACIKAEVLRVPTHHLAQRNVPLKIDRQRWPMQRSQEPLQRDSK